MAAVWRYHDKYRKLWIDAGYRPNMASACAVKPPPKGYRAAYHFLEAEHAIDDIKNGYIKITRIAEANDPFEFESLATKGKKGHELGPIGHEIRRWKEETDKKIGLLCFSKDWRSPTLWAHYSFRHKGICLGFWAKTETLFDVTYDALRTNVEYKRRPPGLSEGMKKLLFTVKARDWSYEEELRRKVELRKAIGSGRKRFFRFDDTLKLSEIILGSRCTQPTLDYVKSLVRRKYKDVAVFKARPAFGYFHMVPDEYTVPPDAAK